MLRNFIIHIGILVLFVFIQAFLFDNMKLSQLQLQPFVFLLAILILPFELPKWFVLVLAFFAGLSIDIINDTLGVNAAAVSFMAYLRPVFLDALSPYDGYENGTSPRLDYYGFVWVLKYTVFSVFTFSIAYYFLVSFSFDYFFNDLLKIFFGSIYSVVLIVIIQFAFFRK